MMGSVRQVAETAVKNYSSSELSGGEAARRAEFLSRAGVTTPSASFDARTGELCCPWIDGNTGREQLLLSAQVSNAGEIATKCDLLTRAIQPLCELRRVRPAGLGLPVLDPWHKIDYRLTHADGAHLGLSSSTHKLAVGVRAELAELWRDAAVRFVVHGDFHLGQIIFDQQAPTVWLLDLDDLAIGPAEFDIANFAAHYVTSTTLYTGDICEGFAAVIRILSQGYGVSTGVELDQHMLMLCGAASLLRRGLKLAEVSASQDMPLACFNASRALVGRL